MSERISHNMQMRILLIGIPLICLLCLLHLNFVYLPTYLFYLADAILFYKFGRQFGCLDYRPTYDRISMTTHVTTL